MPTIVAGIDSDRLYPLRTQREVADRVPGLVGDLRVIESLVGHDGFLVEREAVFDLVTEALGLVEATAEDGEDLDQAAS
jgi:homoserine O-acetyltransferase